MSPCMFALQLPASGLDVVSPGVANIDLVPPILQHAFGRISAGIRLLAPAAIVNE